MSAHQDVEEVTEMLLRFGWGGADRAYQEDGCCAGEPTVHTPPRVVVAQLWTSPMELEGGEERTELTITGSWDEIPLTQLAATSRRAAPPPRPREPSPERPDGAPEPAGRRTPPPPAPPPRPFERDGLGPTRWWARWVGVAAALLALAQIALPEGVAR
jgi:hypothetical protein